jgi:lysylphosphatidylglycerol synthetase-like protein (DUF2156 family)
MGEALVVAHVLVGVLLLAEVLVALRDARRWEVPSPGWVWKVAAYVLAGLYVGAVAVATVLMVGEAQRQPDAAWIGLLFVWAMGAMPAVALARHPRLILGWSAGALACGAAGFVAGLDAFSSVGDVLSGRFRLFDYPEVFALMGFLYGPVLGLGAGWAWMRIVSADSPPAGSLSERPDADA